MRTIAPSTTDAVGSAVGGLDPAEENMVGSDKRMRLTGFGISWKAFMIREGAARGGKSGGRREKRWEPIDGATVVRFVARRDGAQVNGAVDFLVDVVEPSMKDSRRRELGQCRLRAAGRWSPRETTATRA
jgi:hypothetical protein